MRHIVGFVAVLWVAVLTGCSRPHYGPPTASGPGLTTVGADWDDGTSSASFKVLIGYATSPGQIVEIDVANKQYAVDIAEEIVALWNDRFPAEADQASLCGTDIVMFPNSKVGNIAVIDNGTFRRINTEITLNNGGSTVRKVTVCPY